MIFFLKFVSNTMINIAFTTIVLENLWSFHPSYPTLSRHPECIKPRLKRDSGMD